jgi:hypothetical protein
MMLFPTPGAFLFNKRALSEYLQEREATAYSAIAEFDADEILNKSPADLLTIVSAHSQVHVPTLRRDHEFMDTPAETSHEVNDYGRQVTVPGMQYQLTIPFDGDSELFRLRPNSSSPSPPIGTILLRQLFIRVAGSELDVTETRKLFEKIIMEIEKYLTWQRADVGPFNERVRVEATKRITERRKTILDSRNMVASLGYKMHPQLPYPTTHRAPQIQRKPTPVGRAQKVQTFASEPELVEEDYQHILGIIEAMSHVMERSPRSFSHLEEEDLRQHLLVPLNGHYKGEGTAEAFNNIGKTDILIRVEDKNIFVAECKVWGGDKILTAAIDQLLGYLTWRDTKSALIIFSHAKVFTAMLKTMWKGIEAHPNFKRQEKVESETRRRYVFRNKTDPDRELFMTAIAFNIPRV